MAHRGEVPPIKFCQFSKEASKARFCCGEKSVDDYFRKDAWKQHSRHTHRVTHATLAESPNPAGFVAVACVTEEVKKLPGPYHMFGGGGRFPCLQLVWLGVDRSMQRQTIGKRLVGSVITMFADVGQRIGLPHLILVPVSAEVKPFYKDLGFEEYDRGSAMFLPLQSAVEAVGG